MSPRFLRYCFEANQSSFASYCFEALVQYSQSVILCSVLKVIYQFSSSSLHFLYFPLIKDVLRSPDNIPIFYYRPYIGFVKINKSSFVKILNFFTNYGYNTIGFLSNSSGMVMKLQLFVDL